MEAPRSRSGLSTFMICCLCSAIICCAVLVCRWRVFVASPTNKPRRFIIVPCNDDEPSISAKQCLHNQPLCVPNKLVQNSKQQSTMKFSSSILSTALLVSASCSSAAAFSTHQRTLASSSSSMRTTSSTTFLASTTEKETECSSSSSTSTTTRTISPEFKEARDQAIATLKAQLPPEAAPALEQPLAHFVSEYFQALSDSAAAGTKNPDGSAVTPQQAVKNMLTTLSYGLKYGLGKDKFIFEDVRHMALRGADFNDA
eukprot:scaffold6613_cov237-Skeletonema_menzelii.AAC.1